MNFSFSPWNVLTHRLGTIVNSVFPLKNRPIPVPTGYRKVRDLTPRFSNVGNRVGLYKSKDGSFAVMKHAAYRLRDLNALYLSNEAAVLQVIANADIAPKVLEVISTPHSISLVTSFSAGKPLDSVSAKVRRDAIAAVYPRLAQVSRTAARQGAPHIARRSPLWFALSLPYYGLRLTLRNPREALFVAKLTVTFYTNFILGYIRGYRGGLVHRDLYPDNILKNSRTGALTILDWESAVISDPLIDLAQIAMIYYRDFGTMRLTAFLREYLDTNAQRRRFIALSVYNALYIASRVQKDSDSYRNKMRFLRQIVPYLHKHLIYTKSPFETVNTATLSLIYLFYKITGRRIADPKKRILLCYHSIGNDGWRFSTRVGLFRKHMDILSAQYAMRSLPEVVNGRGGGININFDDGYENVRANAYPILQQLGIPATVFALGDTPHADRGELENSLPFMDIASLKQLKKKGWEIGFHTDTHGPIVTLDDKQLDRQFVTGKKRFEKKFGSVIRYLAYPKGYYDKRVLRHVARGGYAAAFTVDGKELNTKGNKYLYDRVPVDGEISPEQLLALISPLGLRVTALYLRLLQLKESLRRRPTA